MVVEKRASCAVVMSVWGRKKLTEDCIRSLHEKTSYPHKLIVVDDGSDGDGAAVIPMLQSFEKEGLIDKLILLQHHPTILRMGKDAVNAGLRWVLDNLRGDVGYIAVQDSDFVFKNRLWLTHCIAALDACSMIRGRDGFNIDVMSVLDENAHKGNHETLRKIKVGPYKIDVKPDIGGGQYVYSWAHFVGLGGGSRHGLGMMYGADENSDWDLFRRHFQHNHHCGHLTHVRGRPTINYLTHTGVGKRAWNQATSPA